MDDFMGFAVALKLSTEFRENVHFSEEVKVITFSKGFVTHKRLKTTGIYIAFCILKSI